MTETDCITCSMHGFQLDMFVAINLYALAISSMVTIIISLTWTENVVNKGQTWCYTKDEGDEKGKDHPISLSSVTKKPSHSTPMPKDEGDDKRDDHLLSLKPTEQTTVAISSSPTQDDPDIWLIYTNAIELFWNPLNGSNYICCTEHVADTDPW